MEESNNSKTFSTEFSEWITKGGLKVDIYTGVKDLYKAVSDGDQPLADKSYIKTGMAFIRRLVDKRIGDFAENIMVEYSLVASTLDPDCPNTLQCCSFISTEKGDKSFIKAISEKYSGCIEEIRKKNNGYSIYQHPYFLYAIPASDPDIWDNGGKRSNFILTEVSRDEPDAVAQNGNDKKEDNIPEENIRSSYIEIEEENLAIGAFPLTRSYSEMVKSAQDLIRNKTELIELKDLQEELHRVCFDRISKRNDKIKKSYYISFPVFGAPATNQLAQYVVGDEKSLQGIGACFIYFEPKDGDIVKNKLYESVSKLVYSIGDVIRYISVNYLFNLGLQLQKRARVEAIKSAKAAIMSRNISHNLGSHVMAYMKHDLSSVEEMLKNGVLQTALPSENVSMEGKEIPYLVGIGKFLSYLQERQDYIATISTDYIPYPSIVNFKDAIYDELNPDYRFQRHPEWAGHKPANILLGNIAKSEGLSRKSLEEGGQQQDNNNILINYKKFDGRKPKSGDKDAENDYESLRFWDFSLPGGIMGRQAVFSIVENVIRNAAKHGTRENGKDLTLTFDIMDPVEGFPKDEKDFWKPYEEAEGISDLYIVTLTDNVVTSPKHVEDINGILNNPFFNDGDDLAASNKGLKEMLISAAWLRSIRIEELISDKQAPPLLARNTKEGFLQYVFCLPKVKSVALITDRKINDDTTKKLMKKLMKKHGWYVYTADKYFNECPNKDFCFIIIDPKLLQKSENTCDLQNDNTISIKEKVKRCSHNRYFVASSKTDIGNHEIKSNVFENILQFNSDISFQQEELNLYEELANESNLRIAIVDKPFKDELTEEKLKKKSDKVSVLGEDKKEFEYIYRKHNDTREYFVQFMNLFGKSWFYKDLKFVDGITGGNSTDRLVRHAELDDLWAYKQLHAMKTKVAIFDERIFTKVTGYAMADLTSTSDIDGGWRLILCGKTIDEAKKVVRDFDREKNHYIKEGVLSVFRRLENLDEVVQFANKNCPRNASIAKSRDGFSSMVFHKKGIDVYTITWESGGLFNIWGFVPDETLENDFGKIEKVGILIVDPSGKEKPSIRMVIDEKNKYHYLSIHQGLLDKIYEKVKEGLNGVKKRMVTKVLHNEFVNCPQTEEDDYLQGLIIHSGRSKPNTENMPQHQPFVQYSAIENAVFDCKYTLVELLDFACFE